MGTVKLEAVTVITRHVDLFHRHEKGQTSRKVFAKIALGQAIGQVMAIARGLSQAKRSYGSPRTPRFLFAIQRTRFVVRLAQSSRFS